MPNTHVPLSDPPSPRDPRSHLRAKDIPLSEKQKYESYIVTVSLSFLQDLTLRFPGLLIRVLGCRVELLSKRAHAYDQSVC